MRLNRNQVVQTTNLVLDLMINAGHQGRNPMEADFNQPCEPSLISNLKRSTALDLVTTSLLILSELATEPPIVLRYQLGVMAVRKITLPANASRNSTIQVPLTIITSTVTANL